MLKIKNLYLKQVSEKNPEHYKVFTDKEGKKQVGCIHLQHRYLCVDYPKYGLERIYDSYNPLGTDSFKDEEERKRYLIRGVYSINQRLEKEIV